MSASAGPSSWQRRECAEPPMHEILNRCMPKPGLDARASAPSRRAFLIAMVGTGVVLGHARSALAAVELPLSAAQQAAPGNLFEPTIWYSIDRNGAVTVNIIRAEMGQHIGTALARIVADELEADWNKVR